MRMRMITSTSVLALLLATSLGLAQSVPDNQQQRQPDPNAAQAPQQQGTVALNVQQQTRLSQAVTQLNVRPLTNVNFTLAVGTAVPSSVVIQPLPSTIVEILPQYRGFSFFVVQQQIVIVNPRSHQIVAMVPYSGGARAQAP